MDKPVIEQAKAYFKQQAELYLPDYIFTSTELSADKITAKKNIGSEKSYQSKRAALLELYNEVKNCNGCNLYKTRNKMVFGGGNADASLMIIGEAPGYEEDVQGAPFVGKAGALLTKMVEAIDLNRERDVFITNILKCRPPNNRNPNNTEISACKPILTKQIEIISPKVILALGRIAAHELLNVTNTLGKLRAEIHNYNGVPVVVTYHPAALLRNEQYKRPAWEDLKKLRKLLKEIGFYDNRR